MRKRLLFASLLLALIGLAWVSVLNTASGIQISPETGNYEASYTFTVQNGFYQSDHVLHISFPPSLREYYAGKSHLLNDGDDYPKFVTPDVVKSLAENIRNITRNTPYDDEEFANAVLTIVRQIPYVRSDAKYPVETLVDNQADCDGLSILAASILKAGGLDAVLLYYSGINPSHMNVGVSLDRMPVSRSWWMAPSGVDYDNKTYWIAECTPLADWTVGTRPELLERNKPEVIPLGECEKEPPGAISSSLSPLELSSISIDLSTKFFDFGGDKRIINVSGVISPILPNASVALYVSQPNSSPSAFTTTVDDAGNYTILWNVTLPATYIVKTSWSGGLNFSGSDSAILTVFVDAQRPPIEALDSSDGDAVSVQSWGSLPSYLALLSQNGKEFLKSSLTGTNIVLSGDFMIVSDGHEPKMNDSTITIPAFRATYRPPGSRRTFTMETPERTIRISATELLNNQFGFILQSTGENNYTGRVKLLNDSDVSQIVQSRDESRAVVLNASEIISKNSWLKAVAKVSSDQITVEVYDGNGTRLDRITSNTANYRYGEIGILLTYPIGQVLAFKNLKVETLSQSPPSVIENSASTVQNQTQDGEFGFLYPCLRYSFLFAGVLLVLLGFRGRKGRRTSSAKIKNNHAT